MNKNEKTLLQVIRDITKSGGRVLLTFEPVDVVRIVTISKDAIQSKESYCALSTRKLPAAIRQSFASVPAIPREETEQDKTVRESGLQF